MLDDLTGRQWLFTHLLIIAAMVMLLAPLLRYMLLVWRIKKCDILDGFDAAAVEAYYKMFNRSATSTPAKALADFEESYSRFYGRQFFILPALILFGLGYLSITMVVFTALDRAEYIKNPIFNLSDTAIAAVAGAYLWVVHDLILRLRRLDLTPSDVLWSSLRLAIAIPMGHAITSILAEAAGPFVAFALAAFPLSALLSIMRRVAEKKMGLGESKEEASDALVKLQGMNRAIVERLHNEDITTITQIAYCDPVRVVMRSNLSFNFVSDVMNQALAWMYFEEKLDVIRPMGLRGAVEIRNFIEALDEDDPSSPLRADHARAVEALPFIARALGQDPATVQIVFREIATDPYTEFLSAVW